MAEEVVVPSLSLPGGVAREGWKSPAAPRGTLGYVWDQGVGLAQGAIDVLQTPATLVRDATQDAGGDAAMQTAQHAALDAKGWLGRQKTAYGRELEEKQKAGAPDERGLIQEAGEMALGTAPALGAAAVTGPFAPLTFGALAVGSSGLSAEEQLRHMSEEDLLKTPVYSKHRKEGMNHAEAQRATYHDMRTLESIAPDMVMNTIFGGIAGRLVGKAFSKTAAGSMRQRIMQTVMQDVPEGVIGGAASGAATDYSRQTGQVQGGLRQDIDWGQVGTSAIDVARPAGIISGAIALGRGIRRPPGAPRPAPGNVGKLIDDANKQVTPEVGTDVKAVADENLSTSAREAPDDEGGAPTVQNELLNKINVKRAAEGKPPLTQEHFDAQANAANQRAPINPEGSTARVTPPGNEPAAINPEGSTARVTPPRPAAGPVSEFAEKLMAETNAKRAEDGLPPLPREDFGLYDTPGATHEFDFKGAFSAGPGGPSADLYNRTFEAYQKGSTRVAGNTEPLLVKAKAEGKTFASPRELREYMEAELTRPKEATAPRFRDVDVIKQQIDHLEGMSEHERATPEWRAEHQRLSEEYDRISEGAAPKQELPPGAEQVITDITAPPEDKPFTKEQLKARLADPEQTPTLDAFRAHVKEWRDANKGVKLPEHNDWQKEWTRAAGERTKAAKPAKEKAAKPEAPVVRLEEQPHSDPKVEALRLKWAEHTDKASARELNDPAWQAVNDRMYEAFADAEFAARPKSKKDQIREQAVAKQHAKTIAAAKAVEDAKNKPTKTVTRRSKKPAPKVEPKVEPPPLPSAAEAGGEGPRHAALVASPYMQALREEGNALKLKAPSSLTKAERARMEAIRKEIEERLTIPESVVIEVPPGGTRMERWNKIHQQAIAEGFGHEGAMQLADRQTAREAAAEVTPASKPAEHVAALVEEAPKEPVVTKVAEGVSGVTSKLVKKKETTQEQKDQAADARGNTRENQTNKREGAAKSVVDTAIRQTEGHNTKVDWNAREAAIGEGTVEGTVQHVKDMADTIAGMVRNYLQDLKGLAGGNPRHDVYTIGTGKTGKARAKKGEYHGFMVDLHNRDMELQDALARANDETLTPEKRLEAQTEAKDIVSDFLDNFNLVRSGKISDFSAKRAERNAKIKTDASTNKASDAQVELVAAKRAAAGLDETVKPDAITEQDVRTTPLAPGSVVIPMPKIPKGRRTKRDVENWGKTPDEHGLDHNEWVNGTKLGMDEIKLLEIEEAQQKYWESLGSPPRGLTLDEFLEVADYVGDPITRSTLGEEMKPFRPTGDRFVDQVMRRVFDTVYDMVKDMPALTMSPELLEAKIKDARASYSGDWGAALFRPDTKVARTVIHEALHAATYRALEGSKRLKHLVTRLQNIIKYNPGLEAFRGTDEFDRAFNSDPHEFISELFTRPEVRAMVASTKLSLRDVLQLRKAGYQIDKGKTLLGTLWSNFLKAIGFQPATPDAMKVAIDMVQDVFEREHQIRARDVALGRTDIGRIYSENEIRELARQDPLWGTAAARKIRAGDHAGAADALMNMADKMDARTADASIKYLTAVNDGYWGGRTVPDRVTPMGTPTSLRGDFNNFLADRVKNAKGPKDLGWQIRNRFATPLRHLSQGIRYTNDLGNNLEQGFRNILQPLKDAWSRREHFSQEYMDKSGANKLIDDLARLKNAIGDRDLWDRFEKLLIRESYARAFADEELGTGRNKHIDTGSRRDRQSVADHKINREIYEKFIMNHPQLKDMRNRIHDFMAKEMEQRHRYMARDMILKWNVAKSGDEDAVNALVKNIRKEDARMTPQEKAAFDRIVGEHDGVSYKDWQTKRADIRKLIQENTKAGPHVPFMRHGKHVVYAEYDVKPDAGVKYNEVNPELGEHDVHKIYDFANEKDADHFIDNTLNHPDVEITVRNAHDIVYDTQTGKRASVYTDEEMAEFAKKGEKHANRYLTAKDLKQMAENNIPTGHYEVRHRVEFNPTEYVRFDSEREAHDFRDFRDQDHSHPNVSTKVTHVETPKDLIGRANVSYTSAELQQWVNRMEASPAYQQMTEEQKINWKREMRIEAARVTMTAGRRTMMMPREYSKGASLNILKNVIDFAGNNARAHAELAYRDDIDKARQAAHDYANQFRHSSGRPGNSADAALTRTLPEGTPAKEGLSRDEMLEQTGHRARQDVLREIDRRLFAPPQVEGSWAIGIKRALQVSMISHLADTGYLMVNAIEPWVFGAAITASRHGFKSYASLAEAQALIDPMGMAKKAFWEGVDVGKEFFTGAQRKPQVGYEQHLLDAVTGARNKRGDGENLGKMLQHMFSRGLVARDVGMEVERIHDPSGNWVLRKMDTVDAGFRVANSGIETGNRAGTAISNFRLEYDKAIRDGVAPDKAYDQALKYAEDQIFKGAGDYSSWNNPRYMNNPYLKMGSQFKKYSLRIASVWTDAMIQAARGDREKQKQIAFMFVAQALAGGAFSTPLSVIPGGLVNAMYLLGATDDNWDDWMHTMRRAMVDHMGLEGADIFMNGVLDQSGANFSSKMNQSSMVFFGDPESRDPKALTGAMGSLAFGAPWDAAMKFKTGINKTFEAASHFSAGANEKGWQAAAEASENIIQIKQLHDLVRAVTLANTGPPGMPKGNEASTIQAAVQAIGFTPTAIARKQEEKRVFKREMKKESVARNIWIDRWQSAPNSTAQNAMWQTIQRDYNSGIPDKRLHITQGELFKAKERKKREAARDPTHLGIKLSGRQKAFADIHRAYSEE